VTKQQRAVVGFIGGVMATTALTKAIDRDAEALGIPHVVVGLLVSFFAHELRLTPSRHSAAPR
jgi:hypothetical protein